MKTSVLYLEIVHCIHYIIFSDYYIRRATKRQMDFTRNRKMSFTDYIFAIIKGTKTSLQSSMSYTFSMGRPPCIQNTARFSLSSYFTVRSFVPWTEQCVVQRKNQYQFIERGTAPKLNRLLPCFYYTTALPTEQSFLFHLSWCCTSMAIYRQSEPGADARASAIYPTCTKTALTDFAFDDKVTMDMYRG